MEKSEICKYYVNVMLQSIMKTTAQCNTMQYNGVCMCLESGRIHQLTCARCYGLTHVPYTLLLLQITYFASCKFITWKLICCTPHTDLHQSPSPAFHESFSIRSVAIFCGLVRLSKRFWMESYGCCHVNYFRKRWMCELQTVTT